MNLSMNDYFDSFTLRTKVNGSSSEERYNNILSRWRKTTEDSKLRLEREGGEYTSAFYEAHRHFLECLDNLASAEERFAFLADAKIKMSNARTELYSDALPESQGKVDAWSFLIAEINEVLK